jgi:hypothetical protein
MYPGAPGRRIVSMLRLAPLLTCLAALALPASATAAPSFVSYNVYVDATVVYDHQQHWLSAHPESSRRVETDESRNFTVQVKSVLPMVGFSDGLMLPYGGRADVQEKTGGQFVRHVEDTWAPAKHTTCVADGLPVPGGHAELEPAGVEGSSMVSVRIADALLVKGNCDDGSSPGRVLMNADAESEDRTAGPLDDVFEIPRSAVGMGEIVQTIGGSGSGSVCPGYEQASTMKCDFSWSGIVTFIRKDFDAVVDPPATTKPEGAQPVGTPYDPTKAVDEAIKRQQAEERARQEQADIDRLRQTIKDYLQSAKASMKPGASTARVELSCPGACSGTATAYAATGPRSAGTGTPLARASFAPAPIAQAGAGAGRKVRATIRLDRGDRRRVAKQGYLAVRVAMRFAGSSEVQRTTVTMKARPR